MENILLAVFLTLLVVTSVAVCYVKRVIHAVIVFGVYSVIMSVVWQQLGSPDLALTEAVAGIGMSVIMVAVLTRLKGECR